LALVVPLSRFTPRVGGGSAFFVRLLGHFMTITQVAILLMRLFGVYLFFDAVVVLTELPSQIYNMTKTQVDYMKPEYELYIAMSLVRLFIYVVLGACFLFFARPLAKLFTRDL